MIVLGILLADKSEDTACELRCIDVSECEEE